MDTRHLVRFDTDRIKDYVFATDRLREVRGARDVLHCSELGAAGLRTLMEALGR